MGYLDALATPKPALADPEAPSDAATETTEPDRSPPVRKCKWCSLPLKAGERKVHRGTCARRRKSELQWFKRHRGPTWWRQ